MSYLGKFLKDVEKFNEMYKLPNNDTLTPLGAARIKNFMDILNEEVQEGNDLLSSMDFYSHDEIPTLSNEDAAELADWLGDIIIYCASEARRWGIPLDKTLKIIMESNFSKLDEYGNPIYDERGKVLKGPNYWKPEPKLTKMLSKPKTKKNK
mgnify:CR=1 FL=1